jgi:hypothetical protein
VEKFVRHLCRLVLRHQMPVWNYFVNSFYSASSPNTLILRIILMRLHVICAFGGDFFLGNPL